MRKPCAPDENRRHAERISDVSQKVVENEDVTDGLDSGIKESHTKTARETAMRAVAASACTEKKLRDKLYQKKIYTQDEIEDALEYVKSFGYINDKRLAENSLAGIASRLWGKQKICRYFISKGISEEIVQEMDFSEIDFLENCKRLAEKNKDKPREKLIRTLLNAGFTYDEVFTVVEED